MTLSPARRRSGAFSLAFSRRLGHLAIGLAMTSPLLSPPAFAQGLPALAPNSGLRRPPLANLPPLPPAAATPHLEDRVSCPALQQRIASAIGGEAYVWSVTVADGRGRLLADVNGTLPRLPASNQKLLSTAFALDRLGPDYRLTTQLWQLADGTFRLTGQGDPDLALPQLQRFAQLALRSGAGNRASGGAVRIELAEEPSTNWWPDGWKESDRAFAYGAPITRLAITSNAIEEAVTNPPSRLRTLLKRSATQQGGDVQLAMVSSREPLPQGSVLLHEEPSTSMYGLLSLANTESHNFTAEVLLRQAAGTWDVDQASRIETAWLYQQGLPMEGVRVMDGSGLDRRNRLTSRFLAALLLRMAQHPYGRYYLGSMAIAGQRGTLRHLFNGTSLDGRFYGKTGTLTGVRAISGVLQTSDGPRYVSAISNGAEAPNGTIGRVLRQAQDVSLCGSAS